MLVVCTTQNDEARELDDTHPIAQALNMQDVRAITVLYKTGEAQTYRKG